MHPPAKKLKKVLRTITIRIYMTMLALYKQKCLFRDKIIEFIYKEYGNFINN